MSKIIVRRARIDDIEFMTDELELFSKEYGTIKSLIGSRENCKARLPWLIENHVVFVAFREDTTKIGFIAGIGHPHIFNQKIKVLGEVFFWVCEEYRGSRAGLLLLRSFIAEGEKNYDWVTMATIGDNSRLKPETLEKQGFVKKETGFLLEVRK